MSGPPPKPLLISLVVPAALTLPASVHAADELPEDARKTFEWLASLGFPDVAKAQWADVHTGAWTQHSGKPPAQVPMRAMVLPEVGGQFTSLDLELESTLLSKTGPDTPAHKRVDWEPRSLE